MKNNTLTLGSLFDGSGGFPLAGLLAGITPVWASEIEPFPVLVTRKRLPDMRHYGDVSALSGAELPSVDVITFGFPCQSVSVAGKREGMQHVDHGGETTTRSGLFYEAVRIIKEMRDATNGQYPRYAVAENVPGLFSAEGGENFRSVLEEICRIKNEAVSVPRPSGKWTTAGEIVGDDFSVAWRVMDAQYFGVPQRRRRVLIVADFAGQCAGKILFESEGLSRYSPQGFRAWQRAAGGAAESAGASGVCLNDQGGERMELSGDVTGTLRAQDHGHPPLVMSAGFCTEHSADARSIGYEEERSPTLRAGVVPAALAVEYNPTDSRIKVSEDGQCQTLTRRNGTGGNTTPLVAEPVPYMLKIRCGCSGGGKGALWQEDKSATLSTNNDQTLFQPKAFGIGGFHSQGMLSDNPHAGIYEADTARTLDTSDQSPAKNQGGIAVVAFAQNQRNDVRNLHNIAGALAAEPGMKQQTYIVLEGNGSRPSHRGDGYAESDIMYTLNATEVHSVAEPKGEHYSSSKNSHFTDALLEQTGTLVATDYKDPPIVNDSKTASGKDVFGTLTSSMSSKQWLGNQEAFSGDYHIIEPEYIVRRITPTEAARLQGFPDWWCDGLSIPDPSKEELAFWQDVWETWRKNTNPDGKPKTEKQIRRWLTSPHTDAAEYKLWGNGVCLSVVWFVLAGIVWADSLEAPTNV